MKQFGVTRESLESRQMTDGLRRLLAFQTKRAREYYEDAHAAVNLLHPASRECVHTALTLYAGILDSLEQADYQVFGVRHGFSKAKALRIAGPAYVRARRSWRAAA